MERAALLRLVTIVLWLQGCSGPPLEPWHIEKPREEFTAAKARKVRTFDDSRPAGGDAVVEQSVLKWLEEAGSDR